MDAMHMADEIGEFSFFSDETEIVGEGLPPPSPPLTPSKHNTRGSASPRKVARVADGKRGSSEEAASFTILAKRSLFSCCTAIHMQWVGHIPARTVLSELTLPFGSEEKNRPSLLCFNLHMHGSFYFPNNAIWLLLQPTCNQLQSEVVHGSTGNLLVVVHAQN